jgi:ATP-dependent Clp protease ATP-binding subunit ClpC
MSTTPYSPRLSRAITLSHAAASRLGQAHVGPEQLMLGLLGVGDGSALRMLASVGVTPDLLEPQLVDGSHGGHSQAASTEALYPLSPEAENALYIASREASFWDSEKVETMHLLLALLRDDNTPLARLLDAYGVQYQFLFDMAAFDRVGLRLA